ncbi:MAG: glycosyltransferase, partial [Candidatus Omnitrophota bacterium]
MILRVGLIGELLRSTWKLAVIYKARDRFKAISEDDKLYDGRSDNDLNIVDEQRRNITDKKKEISIAYSKFINTVFGKYTQDDLALIEKAGLLKSRHPSVKPGDADYWKNLLTSAEVLKYEQLFGKGAEPSGAVYKGLGQATGEERRQILERVYDGLSVRDLIDRMSGAGFNELKKEFGIDDKLTLWAAMADPAQLKDRGGNPISANQIRDFFNRESPNERKIIVMYDLLPKFTPWIVVVMGADALFKLINALLGFRYPLNKLKFIFAGENWDTEVQDSVRKNQKAGKYPPQLVFRGATVREDGRPGEPSQAYTKPGANTAVLNESDGISGIIYDAENIPAPNQILQLVLGTMDGIAKVRHLVDTRVKPAIERNWVEIDEDRDGVNVVVDKVSRSVNRIVSDYMAGLNRSWDAQARQDLSLHHQFNLKTDSILRRQLKYFTNHALRKLLELTEKDERLFSTGMLWEHINKYAGDTSDSGIKEKRELINLYIALCNMPEYGEFTTKYLKKEISKNEFIQQLIIGEYRRINEPKNGQGRLAKINTALHRSPGQVSAYMYGEYASWYTAGWDGFMAAQDTFKPLGGTTGYFCTEPIEDIDWKDPAVALRLNLNEKIELTREGTKTNIKCSEIIAEHHRTKNKLLTLGAWDEYQVAEDYMLGFVSWYYGFNIAAFYSLTPEDPAGLESGLSFKYRPKQMSRWIKGYIIGLLVISENGNLRDLMERKGWWGAMVFFIPTLCSAVHPIMFRIARFLTIFWWIHFMPLKLIGGALLSSPIVAPIALGINKVTGIGTFMLDLQTGVDMTIPRILNFLPTGWAWGIGAAIIIVPIFLHRFYTMRGIVKGVNDYLGRKRILEEYDEWIEDVIGIGDAKRGGITTLYSDIKALNNPAFDDSLVEIMEMIERYKDDIEGTSDQGGDVNSRIISLRTAISSTGLAGVDVITGKLNALEELISRREIVRTGSLVEMPGVVSPRRYAFGMSIFIASFVAIIFSSGYSIP